MNLAKAIPPTTTPTLITRPPVPKVKLDLETMPDSGLISRYEMCAAGQDDEALLDSQSKIFEKFAVWKSNIKIN